MSEKNKAVFGIYESRAGVERAVLSLKGDGFLAKDISILVPEGEDYQEFAHIKVSKAPEGAATGAGTGALIGGTLGLLAGIGSLAIPGIGPFIAAGPIMATLAGLGVGGTIGGISGALIGLGIPEIEAKKFEGHVEEGGILLSVHTGDSVLMSKAKVHLEATGAKDVACTEEVSQSLRVFQNPVSLKEASPESEKMY